MLSIVLFIYGSKRSVDGIYSLRFKLYVVLFFLYAYTPSVLKYKTLSFVLSQINLTLTDYIEKSNNIYDIHNKVYFHNLLIWYSSC